MSSVAWEKYLLPYLLKHPALLLILAMISIAGIFGYFNVMAAVDKKADSETVGEMQRDLAHVKGRIDQVLSVLTGKPIDGEHPKSPPPAYFVGEDSIWLITDYDSCKCGFITDTTEVRPPWHCWYRDSNNKIRMKTFR